MAKEEKPASSGLSYSFLIELAESEAAWIEAAERGAVEVGWRKPDGPFHRERLRKVAGFRALARMARHVAAREFGVFTKGGME